MSHLEIKKFVAPLSKIKMPSHAENELKLVEKEIKALKSKLSKLKKKEKREGLSSDEQVDLEEFDKELEKLEADKKYWQDRIPKGN